MFTIWQMKHKIVGEWKRWLLIVGLLMESISDNDDDSEEYIVDNFFMELIVSR